MSNKWFFSVSGDFWWYFSDFHVFTNFFVDFSKMIVFSWITRSSDVQNFSDSEWKWIFFFENLCGCFWKEVRCDIESEEFGSCFWILPWSLLDLLLYQSNFFYLPVSLSFCFSLFYDLEFQNFQNQLILTILFLFVSFQLPLLLLEICPVPKLLTQWSRWCAKLLETI